MSLRSAFSALTASTAFNRLAGLAATPSRWIAPSRRDIRQARRILIIKPDEIGDVVLATGFFRLIRRHCPQAHITIAVRRPSVPLIEIPAMGDEVLIWNDQWRAWSSGTRAWRDLVRTARARFRSAPPDWVLIPRGNGDHMLMAFFAWWSGGRRICAHESFATEWAQDRRSLINELIPDEGPTHELGLHRRMLAYLGLPQVDPSPEVAIPDEAVASVDALLAKTPLPARRVALGIGAGSPSRVWPLANYQKLIETLLMSHPYVGFVVIGDASNRDAGEQLQQLAPNRIVNFAGHLSLLQSAALLRRCQVYVGSDSGPMHLAAAAGCAIVEISKHPLGAADSSPNSPLRFGPVTRARRILQPEPLAAECADRGCEHREPHCITAVSVESVQNAALVLLAISRTS